MARFVIRAIDAVRDFFRAAKEADRVRKDVAETTQAVEESFNAASEVNSVSTATAADDVRTTDSGGGGSPGCNSFVGATLVLLASGTTKPIDQVKVGDKVANAQPGSPTVQQHVVTAVHVTYADRAFDATSCGRKLVPRPAGHADQPAPGPPATSRVGRDKRVPVEVLYLHRCDILRRDQGVPVQVGAVGRQLR